MKAFLFCFIWHNNLWLHKSLEVTEEKVFATVSFLEITENGSEEHYKFVSGLENMVDSPITGKPMYNPISLYMKWEIKKKWRYP